MKKKILLSTTQGMSKDVWLKFRTRGIGASEVGTILGLNQYKASIELFYEKVMPGGEDNFENMARFMGHYDEDKVADLWQYWDKTEESIVTNYRAGRVIRKCQRVNAYAQNPDYPWLFVSLDRKINKGERGEEGALEIKTINGYEADKWETGIPPAYIVQVMTQLLVCEFTFGELAVMRDGRKFEVYPFEFNQAIAQQIIERTKEFWDKVVEGRKIMTQKFEAVSNHNMRLVQSLQHELEALEPAPDGSEAYAKFLKEKFKRSLAEEGLVKGDDVHLAHAVFHKEIKGKIKLLEADALLYENLLKRKIGDKNKLDFGANGYVSWQGNPRRFSNKVKA